MRSSQRVQLVRGYLLHQRPWRDSSLIIEVFSADFGRLTTFARPPEPYSARVQPGAR